MSEKQNSISLEGLDKAAVLAALYNGAKPQGLGFLQYDPSPMRTEDAKALFAQGTRFDYVQGRVLKVDLGKNTLDPRSYDHDNGSGAAEAAVNAVRIGETNTPDIEATHKAGVLAAAADAVISMARETTSQDEGGVSTINLGLADVADKLQPAVMKALDEEGKENT